MKSKQEGEGEVILYVYIERKRGKNQLSGQLMMKREREGVSLL